MNFKFVDACAGLGGFHLALKALGGECVLASEINERLRILYQKNHGISPVGDIWSIDPNEVPMHDVFCAGFPCQPFSKAGTQLGWRDAARGTVFLRIVEIIECRRPEFIILENVANFERHDDGNTFIRVQAALTDLGYEVRTRKVSPHNFGVPQVRDRLFFVARRKALGGLQGFHWPEPSNETLDIASILDDPAAGRRIPQQLEECLNLWQEFLDKFPYDSKIPSFPIWAHEFSSNYPTNIESLWCLTANEIRNYKGSFGQPLIGKSKADLIQGVPSYARARAGAFPRWKQEFIRQNRELYSLNSSWLSGWMEEMKRFPSSYQKLEWNCQGEQRNIFNYILQTRASGIRVKRRTTAPALVAMTTTQVPIIGWQRRFMTPRECAKLQSMENLQNFPADTYAFKALGNAVNVKVVRLICRQLLALRGFAVETSDASPALEAA